MANPRFACQCGAITLPTPQPAPLEVYVCHCTQCQRQSSTAHGVSAIFPIEGVLPFPEELQPHIAKWTRPTDAGNTLECYFCKVCGVRILHHGVLPDGTPKKTVSIKGGGLEGVSLARARHIWTAMAKVPVPSGSTRGEPKD